MVLIASNITKIVDVIKTGCTSIEILHKNLMLVEPHYIEQTPPQYMHGRTWWSFLYIHIHATTTTNVDMHEPTYFT